MRFADIFMGRFRNKEALERLTAALLGELGRLRNAIRDPVYYVFLSLAAIAWFLPDAQPPASWLKLAWLAFVEELFFRAAIQGTLRRTAWGVRTWGPLSLANVVSSSVFALFHLTGQPPLWALSTFFPGLVFGMAWDRHQSLVANTFLHYFYNVSLFYGVAIFTIWQ